MQLGAHEATETRSFSLNTVAKDLGVCDPWGFGVSGWLSQLWLIFPWESQSLVLVLLKNQSKDYSFQGNGQSLKNLVGKEV